MGGIDAESLDLILQSIRDFARAKLPDALLLELDAKDEFPEALIREMGTELGVQLVFIAEEHGGMGGGAFDVYRVLRADGAHRRRRVDGPPRHLPRQRPDRVRRHRRAEGEMARQDRR